MDREIERFRRWMVFLCLIGSIAVSLTAVVIIAIAAWNSQWLTAIFFLLARKEIAGLLDSEAERIGKI
jgi:hypothetical protein